ncbi:tetratricopeptide repeat protein [Streptomyces galilaeus]
MTSKQPAGGPAGHLSAPGVTASKGSNAAGGDIINSVAMHAETVLPAEAYAPIPGDAAADGLSNIREKRLFVGRTAQLEALDAAFAPPGGLMPHVLSGLGGVGKTFLAAHWAATRAAARVRWWITADSRSALEEGLAGLACALQPGLAQLPAQLQIERALEWLAGQDDWLIVLDGVDYPDDIRPLLDRAGSSGRVLVTTRRATGWHHLAATLCLDVFAPGESADLFTRVLAHDGLRDAEGIEELCEELGHLALAVEQVAAFCHETAMSPGVYLTMLRQSPADMYEIGPESGDDKRTVARIWRLTLDRLGDTPLAGQILRILAWYAPDRIPRSSLDGLADSPALTVAIGRLLAYSMISSNSDGTLSVHGLVQSVVRTPHPDDPHRQPDAVTEARKQAINRINESFPADTQAQENWPLCRALLPHVKALARHCPPEADTVSMACVLNRASVFELEHVAFPPVIDHQLRVFAACERVFGAEHRDTLASCNNVAYAHALAGNFKEAILLFLQILVARTRVLGADHPDTLISLSSLADAYMKAGEFQRATALYEQAVAASERVLDENHPHRLIFRQKLAAVCRSAGDLTRAIPLLGEVLATSERVLGKDHLRTLGARNSLARAYDSAGELALAIPLYEENLTEQARVLGHDNPRTLAAKNYLACAYASKGDCSRAIDLYKEALDDYIRVLGEGHSDTLISRRNLAAAYKEAGKLAWAIPLYKKALTANERAMGRDHPDTMACQWELADAYMMVGNPARAVPLYEGFLAAGGHVMDDPDALTARRNLAQAYAETGNLPRAVPLIQQTFDDRIRLLGEDHPDTLISQGTLASAYELAGDLARAVRLYEQNLTARTRVLGPDHPDTRTSLSRLEMAYRAAGDLARPIPLFKQAQRHKRTGPK